ncbi:adenylate cyclase type 9, partial [Plakobranchus ocellatus]
GVHTGTVLCGIVGTVRFKFDVWSNDVTLANTMESTGEPGKVHISESTRDFCLDEYEMVEGEEVPETLPGPARHARSGKKAYVPCNGRKGREENLAASIKPQLGRSNEAAWVRTREENLIPCVSSAVKALTPASALPVSAECSGGQLISWSATGDISDVLSTGNWH